MSPSTALPPNAPALPATDIHWADPVRQAHFATWFAGVQATHGLDASTLGLASADASFRRYFRVQGPSGTRVIMDAPPDKENSQPFVDIASLLTQAGLRAPEILDWNQPHGFMLLSDLGTQTMMQFMDARGDLNPAFSATGQALSAPPLALYLGAVDTLVQWQLASKPHVLPPYDHALLLRELELFPQWYVAGHRQVTLDTAQRKVLDDTFALLIENNLSWPSVYVHRDFMPRNLMVPNEAPTLGTGVSSLPPEGALAARGGPAPLTPVVRVAVVAYPRISNLDEFQPLKNIPGLRLQWVRSPSELAGLTPADWIILPGSKHTSGDLAWLRSQRLDAAIARHAEQGGAVLGVCGGLQMLGEALIDPHGIDGNAPGLGLLPLVTVFAQDKTVRHTQTAFFAPLGAHAEEGHGGGLMLPNAQKSPPAMPFLRSGARKPSPWAALAGVSVAGYEIHHGQTQQHVAMAAAGNVARAVLPDGLGWCNTTGNVLGVYLHGMFEDAAVLQALFGAQLGGAVPTLETVFDGLADYIGTHFAPGVLQDLLN